MKWNLKANNMQEDSKDVFYKLKEEISKSELENKPIVCCLVNPKDYNNYIAPMLNSAAKVNYESTYFGNIEPLRIYGIKIIANIHISEGSFVKSTTDLTNQPFTNNQPIGVKNFLKEEK